MAHPDNILSVIESLYSSLDSRHVIRREERIAGGYGNRHLLAAVTTSRCS